MENADMGAKLVVCKEKFTYCVSQLPLLKALSERVFLDVCKIEKQIIELTALGPSEAEMAAKKADKIEQLGPRSEASQRAIEESRHAFNQASAEIQKNAEHLDVQALEGFLDRAITKIKAAQTDLEKQLFELQEIAAEIDRLLDRESPKS